jgi:hypothetical protein
MKVKNAILKNSGGVLSEQFNDTDYVLYNPAKKMICVVNECGYLIWKETAGGKSVQEAARVVRKKFCAIPPEETLQAHIKGIIVELRKNDMLPA